MKTFLQSSATKFLLGALAIQLLVDIRPMLAAHSIDLWALADGQIGLAIALLGNALRPDVDAPGFNWFNKKSGKV